MHPEIYLMIFSKIPSNEDQTLVG